jgi:hypothetical protein
MLEGRTTDDLRAIAIAGGGLEINGGAYTTDDLRAIAIAASGSAPLLVIHNSRTKTTADLRAIAIAGRGKVVFA